MYERAVTHLCSHLSRTPAFRRPQELGPGPKDLKTVTCDDLNHHVNCLTQPVWTGLKQGVYADGLK